MNKLKIFLSSLTLLFVLSACGETESGGNNSDSQDSANQNDSPAESDDIAASTWDGHSLKDGTDKSAKWITSVKFGEEMTLLGENEAGSKYSYEKVRLLDGKEGWLRDDLIHKGGKMGVVTQTQQVYSRPSISNISDKEIESGTLVVLKQTKEEFKEFISKNEKGKNRQRGWLLGSSSISTDGNEIALAVLISQAKSELNPIKRSRKLENILDNEKYKNSILIEVAQGMLTSVNEIQELAEDELMITGDKVNVRSAPNTDTDNKKFQVNSGQIVKIMQKGDMDDIGGSLDFWYEIKTDDGQQGWLYGKFTSKAK